MNTIASHRSFFSGNSALPELDEALCNFPTPDKPENTTPGYDPLFLHHWSLALASKPKP